MSFLPERFIDISFVLGEGTFAESGTNTVTLSNHRTKVRIEKAGGPAKQLGDITIYGMSLSLMNRLSTLGAVWRIITRDTVTISAGSATAKSLVYTGNIIAAAADFQNSPDVAFRISSQAGAADGVALAQASSFPGSVPVSQIMQKIAGLMGIPFENSLLAEVYLKNQNLPGSSWDQMKAAARAAGIGAEIDNGKLVIYTLTAPRKGSAVPLSPSTGMVGYPTYISQGIKVRTVFNPAIQFHGQVIISGSIVGSTRPLQPSTSASSAALGPSGTANGTWLVTHLDHRLDSLVPNGDWFSDLYLYRPNPATPAPVIPSGFPS